MGTRTIIIMTLAITMAIFPALTFAASTQKGVDQTGAIESQGPGQSAEARTQIILDDEGDEEALDEATKSGPGQGQANGRGAGNASERAQQRRSQVANAVQEMLQVAERNQGIGQQIRTVAQVQNQNQEQMEAVMEQVRERSAIRKFFFGPDYKRLNSVEDRLAMHEEKLDELRALAQELEDEADKLSMEEQIKIIEDVKVELEQEVASAGKGFSLFGWLNKLLSK